MAALAYVLLPLTGAVAYFGGKSARARFHGLQAIALGLVWPAALYAAAAVARPVVLLVAAGGMLIWLILLIGTAFGRDLALPVVGRILARAAQHPPGGV